MIICFDEMEPSKIYEDKNSKPIVIALEPVLEYIPKKHIDICY